MTCIEIVTFIKEVLVSLAAIATPTIAFLGLQRWKDELQGKAHFETAKALIISTYKLRNGLHRARSPFISAGEFPEGYRGASGKHTTEEHGQAYAKVVTAQNS